LSGFQFLGFGSQGIGSAFLFGPPCSKGCNREENWYCGSGEDKEWTPAYGLGYISGAAPTHGFAVKRFSKGNCVWGRLYNGMLDWGHAQYVLKFSAEGVIFGGFINFHDVMP
jgi:hypothetical protein